LALVEQERGGRSTVQAQHYDCPGHPTVIHSTQNHHNRTAWSWISRPDAKGRKLQLAEWTTNFIGENLGSATIFPAAAPLSDRIYKIYTLLSTGFVEKLIPTRAAASRKPLSGAAFRGMPVAPHGARA
jgi:hypothetical protein